jgi:hypothetical protein
MPEPASSRVSSQPGSGGNGTVDGKLRELRELIFGAELEQISRLDKRLNDPEMRAQDVGEILGTAKIRKSLEQVIRTILKREPDVVVEVIKPVLLVAVRKAVADAFREFTENFNQVTEKSLSLRSLRWRWEALRTGRKFSEIVLSRSLLYSVREVFLIHKETGILLEQTAREAVTKDADMISSMFTAIQEFVRDSFIGTENTALETIEAGALKLWIQHGTHAMLAGAMDGTPPVELKTIFRNALTDIQENFGAELQTFAGDVTPFERTRPVLEKCLLGRSAAKPRRPVSLWVLYGVCVVLLATWVYLGIMGRERWNGFLEKLEKQPGIVITRVENQGSEHVVFGLRDQLAVNPAELLRNSKIAPSSVNFQLEPYESLDAPFRLRRQSAADRQAIEKSVIRFPQGDSQPSMTDLDEIDSLAATISSFFQTAHVVLANINVIDKLRFALLPSVRMRARLFGSIRESLGIIPQAGGAPS